MKNIIKIVLGAIGVILLVQFFWLWGFCRFYVDVCPGEHPPGLRPGKAAHHNR